MTLKTDVDQLAADAVILHNIVHGTSGQTVSTNGGAVKTVAKAVADAEALIVTGAESYLDQCQAETALATTQAQTAQAQAALAAGSALDALSAVEQDLAAIDQAVFAATLVDVFLYDTSKDSDGGAWRKRCSHTSWEAETLAGNWLGSAANEAAARALGGAVTGSYYYDTTALGFYTLNAGSGKTATTRGNVCKFPARVAITAEAARVVIWDLTQAGAPMWMVFVTTANYALHSGTVTSVAALNGHLAVGMSTQQVALRFVADRAEKRNATDLTIDTLSLASRNSAGTWGSAQTAGALVNGVVADVAITVLPTAPFDIATGLPVPTIAVTTNGGVSVIKDDGNVWDITGFAANQTPTKIAFSPDGEIVTGGYYLQELYTAPLPTADVANMLTYGRRYVAGTAPSGPFSGAVSAITAAGQEKVRGHAEGFSRLIENRTTIANGMTVFITKDYNSGWLPGDIRGAWLADSVAETITGSELVTNGDFATDTTGWTAGNGAAVSVVANRLRITNGAANYGYATQAITTVVGKTYTVAVEYTAGTSTGYYFMAGTSAGGANLGSVGLVTNARSAITFTATGTTTYISAEIDNTNGNYADFDNISCRLADVDRSVKAKGLQVFGSLTKAAVASGAQLVGYSGFSAANFLEQPYNSDLDFGTGDFYFMFWLEEAANSSIEYLFLRGYHSGSWSGSGIQAYVASSGVLVFQITDDGWTTVDVINGTITIDDSAPRLIVCQRVGSTTELWINDSRNGTSTVTNASGSLSNASATLAIGCDQTITFPLTNGTLSLLRSGAGSLTAEQIKHIYETERPMFEANANCLLAGTSNAVTALAYDEETDLLHVGTSYGRSAFKGLARVASEATAVGSIVGLAAGAGTIAQAGATGCDVYVPAYLLREELLRDAEQMAKFGQNLIAHDFTATASQTTFALPVGWEIVAVYQQGALKRETTSWTRSFDGFKWSAVLGTGATVSDWISILAKRV